MPREITHWHILDCSLERATETPMVARCIRESLSLTYLGAMTPDALYYHRYGRDLISNTLGERIHGRDGEDTFLLVNAMIRELQMKSTEPPSALWGFIAGYLSHCAADVVFHPWIFYVTGDYYHQDPTLRRGARVRHRLFEVFLDSWFRAHHPCCQGEYVRDHISNSGVLFDAVASLLGRASHVFSDSEMSIEAIAGDTRWHSALNDMALQQSRFLSDRWGYVVFLLNQITGHSLDPIDALCSFRRRGAQSYFDREFEFQNPVSAVLARTSVNSLIEQSIDVTLRYWKALESCLDSAKGEPDLGVVGPSLNYGIVGAHHSSANCYSSDLIPFPGFN